MSAETKQIEANTASLQAIIDNAKEINDLVTKQTDAADEDKVAIQTVAGETLNLPLSALAILIQASGATTINYTSISPPQLFNPDASEVTAGTGDYVLSSLGFVAFVAVNGKVLDDSEYSLTLSTVTVTPDNGFATITDEILIFQQAYSTVGTGGVTYPLVQKSATYTVLVTDYTIECTANSFTVTLPTAVGITGQVFNINNTGTGVVTVATTSSQTINGSSTQTVNQWENLQIQSNGTNWIIL